MNDPKTPSQIKKAAQQWIKDARVYIAVGVDRDLPDPHAQGKTYIQGTVSDCLLLLHMALTQMDEQFPINEYGQAPSTVFLHYWRYMEEHREKGADTDPPETKRHQDPNDPSGVGTGGPDR